MSKEAKLARVTHTSIPSLALRVWWRVDPVEREAMLMGKKLFEPMIPPHPRLRSRTWGNQKVCKQHHPQLCV